MFQTEVEEKIAIHFLCSRKNSFFLIRVVFEVMWETNLQPDAPQMRKHIACFITTDTNAHSEYVIFLPFHCKIDCTNAPQYYVTRASPVVLDTELKRVNKRNWAESGRGGEGCTCVKDQLNTNFHLLRTWLPSKVPNTNGRFCTVCLPNVELLAKLPPRSVTSHNTASSSIPCHSMQCHFGRLSI